MLSEAARRYAALPTAAKLLLILTAALLPIGLGLVWIANEGIREANQVLRERSAEQSRLAARAIESLIARNALALRVAANGRIGRTADPCTTVQRGLTITPAVAQNFALASTDGQHLCQVGDIGETGVLPLVAAGDIALKVAADLEAVVVRVGVAGGMATGSIPSNELQDAALGATGDVRSLSILDGGRELQIVDPQTSVGAPQLSTTEWPVGNGRLITRVGVSIPMITATDRLVLLLPVLMWIIAALMTWLLVTRLLIRPLRRLQRSVGQFQPGEGGGFVLPQKLGPATEIQELRDAFARAVERVELSEREMTAALEGQRRLVREVHHRVKNNLQVVASLLNIHGRNAETPPAREAYAAISRRVGALSVVHRNHFAEMEENRGISLRPLLSELAAELRAGAPDDARALRIDLDLDAVNTTQDVALSVAFLVTEIIEFAMLNKPDDPIEVSLRRATDLTAELRLSSTVLVPDESGSPEKVQFERIISGLAKQLRSDLERKLGRYSVDLPVFPPREGS